MKKLKNTYFANHIAMFGSIFMILLGYLFFIFIYFLLPRVNWDRTPEIGKWIMVFMSIIAPSLFFIFSLKIAFSKITIDESGIRKSLFKRYFKKSILWSEVKEMKIYNRVDTWIFISKVPMEGMTYYQLLKHKDIIQVTALQKIRDLIIKYSKSDLEESNSV